MTDEVWEQYAACFPTPLPALQEPAWADIASAAMSCMLTGAPAMQSDAFDNAQTLLQLVSDVFAKAEATQGSG